MPSQQLALFKLQGHMTSNNETQNLRAGKFAKSMTSEGNSALLPVKLTDDHHDSERFHEFPASKFPANFITNHFKTGPLQNS